MLYPNLVAAYLIDLNNQQEARYLLLRRAENNFLPGLWQMVSGKVEPGESAAIAVEREIREETGLTRYRLYNVDITSFYDQREGQMAFSANFCAHVEDAEAITLSASEHNCYQWLPFAHAFDLLAFPAQKETLRLIRDHYVERLADPVNLVPRCY